MMEIKIINLSKNPLPYYATEGSAGFDIRVQLEAPKTLKKGEYHTFSTGLYVEIPDGTVLKIYNRSGLSCTKGVRLANNVGVIDSDYRGELLVTLINDYPHPYTIYDGERVAQAILEPYYKVILTPVTDLSPTARNVGGYGSTGKC